MNNNDNTNMHDELREALGRLEARRPRTEVPEDFVAGVLRQTTGTRNSTARRIALWGLAAAAAIALLLVPTWHREEPAAPERKLSLHVTELSHRDKKLSLHVTKLSHRDKKISPHVTKLSHRDKKLSPHVTPAPEPADSMEYYIAKIEAGLEAVSESCYEANVERLIRADARLGQLVNRLLLNGIIADSLRQTALSE